MRQQVIADSCDDGASHIAFEITDTPKRSYTKRNTIYWERKTKKAQRRKSRKEKLQHYAGLLARASVIGSAVYKSLPAGRRKHALYKALTGSAMELLKEEWAYEDVKAFLMKMMVKKPGVSMACSGIWIPARWFAQNNFRAATPSIKHYLTLMLRTIR